MLLELLGGALAGKVADLIGDPALDSLHNYLLNERAFGFAKERLRTRYETVIWPATYDHVVEHLRLSKDDFVLYFRDRYRYSPNSLRSFLRDRLLARSEGWLFNRPSTCVLDRLLGDFLDAYEDFFLTSDSSLAVMNIYEISKEAFSLLNEIHSAISGHTAHKASSSGISQDLPQFLSSINIPFELVERVKTRVDMVVMDPSSLFPTRYYVSGLRSLSNEQEVDRLVEAAAGEAKLSHIFLVVEDDPPASLVTYASRRRITIFTVIEFREAFIQRSPNERYILGSLAAKQLCESLNIHDIFISPDAVPAKPSDWMESKYFTIRVPAVDYIFKFLESETDNILFVFGSYGSGKSALAAYITRYLAEHPSSASPVYIALRQIQDPDTLAVVAAKADQLAKTTHPESPTSLVIFDGLDELPNAMETDEKRTNILRIVSAAGKCDKIIVTVRLTYFTGMEDFWSLFVRAGDELLWSNIARFIPDSKKRLGVSALVLREYDSDQIERYVSEFGRINGYGEAFSETFFKGMRDHDPGFNYQILARNPLYLFLLVNSTPWEGGQTKSFGDVIEIFVRYWVERDVEKGKARWLLSTDDRMEFLQFVAWDMYKRLAHCISCDELDKLVKSFFGANLKKAAYSSLVLDLRTTGVFSSTGKIIEFLCPAFFDYFVCRNLLKGPVRPAGAEPPAWGRERLPSLDQVYMLAGFIETRREPGSYLHQQSVRAMLQGTGIEWDERYLGAISLGYEGIIYEAGDGRWPFINFIIRMGIHPSDKCLWFRVLFNVVQIVAEEDRRNALVVKVRNRRGLHARAAAAIVKRFRGMAHGDVTVTVRRDGSPLSVSVRSILGLMMLAAGPGSLLVFEYSGCTREDVEDILRACGCSLVEQSVQEAPLWVGPLLGWDYGDVPAVVENVR